LAKQKLPKQLALSVSIGHSVQPDACVAPPHGPKSEYFPNVVVVTHESRKALFYDDLLRGKTVLINFMSIENEAIFRISENLRMVQRHIGPRLGQDVFMYSITIDPENDTPAALDKFAGRLGAEPGWLFLTGEPTAIRRIKSSLFSGDSVHHHGGGGIEDCSLAMVRYGNEAVGLWGTVSSTARPEWIAQRISWVESRPSPAGPFRRRGPFPPNSASSQER
jgi:protein SCO1